MIILAKGRNRLYYLETPCKSVVSLQFECHLFYKGKIQLRNCRLGQLLSRNLNILFPSLFRKLEFEIFHYYICDLTKHKHYECNIDVFRWSIEVLVITKLMIHIKILMSCHAVSSSLSKNWEHFSFFVSFFNNDKSTLTWKKPGWHVPFSLSYTI